MAHLQNLFGLLSPGIATILPWSESLDKPLTPGYTAVKCIIDFRFLAKIFRIKEL